MLSCFRIEHILSQPSETRGRTIIQTGGVGALGGTVALRYGSPEMIQKAALQALREWECVGKEDCLGFLRYLVYVERDTTHCLVLELVPGGKDQYGCCSISWID